jgi:hypothetical protein
MSTILLDSITKGAKKNCVGPEGFTDSQDCHQKHLFFASGMLFVVS